MLLNQAIPVPSPHPQYRAMVNGQHLRPTYPTEREARAAMRREVLRGKVLPLTPQALEWLLVGRLADCYLAAVSPVMRYRVGDVLESKCYDNATPGRPRVEVLKAARIVNYTNGQEFEQYTLRQVAP